MATIATAPPAGLSESNAQRQADALERRIKRQDKWRKQVWAECQLRILDMQNQLTALGYEQIEIEEADFTDEATLRELAKSGADD
jgi:predicted acetyltransferase